MQRSALVPFVILSFTIAGCSIDSGGSGTDEGLDGGVTPLDSAVADSSAGIDGGLVPVDSAIGDGGIDTGTPVDTATTIDSTAVDSGTTPIDSGIDTAPIDSGIDTAPIDSGVDTTPPPDTAIACGEAGAVRFGGHCYFFLSTGRNWDAARSACSTTTPPAHLVVITSDGEQSAVAPLNGTTDAWIGLVRLPTAPAKNKSSFTWITGEAQIYDAWAGGEPNGTGECARMTGGKWADWVCGANLGTLCERE